MLELEAGGFSLPTFDAVASHAPLTAALLSVILKK